jgi:Terminase large subunit, T4likevirus-type, N-terminal
MMTRSAFLSRLALVEAAVLPPPVVQVPAPVELFTRSVGAPDPWQVAVLQYTSNRTLLNCSRQSGKSACVAVLALHHALVSPGALILLLSPSLRQSQELFRKVADAYRALGHPAPLEAESALRYELANGSRLIALPGTEPTIRGYSGVDLLVIDEAARVHDELYYAVRPMMAIKPAAQTVCLSTPFGKRGWFFQEWTAGEDWARVEVNALACPRISAAFLAQERRSLPRLWFESEYMCQFAETEDSVFRYEDVMACVHGEVVPFLARR